MRYLLLILLFISCNPVKQVLRSPEKTLVVVDKYLQQYPIVSDTLYQTIKGDSIVNVITQNDTSYIHDSITNERVITKYLTRIVSKTDTTVKTIIDRTFQMTLQREVAAKGAVLDQREKDLSDMKASRNKFRLWFWVLVGAIGGGGILWIYLKIKP